MGDDTDAFRIGFHMLFAFVAASAFAVTLRFSVPERRKKGHPAVAGKRVISQRLRCSQLARVRRACGLPEAANAATASSSTFFRVYTSARLAPFHPRLHLDSILSLFTVALTRPPVAPPHLLVSIRMSIFTIPRYSYLSSVVVVIDQLHRPS